MPNPAQGPVHRRVPPGDNRPRLVCDDCGFVNYQNTKVVVGTVSSWQGKVLLVKRAIEPRKGCWTLPAGFLEEHETSDAGAARETFEEACARVRLDGLLAVYSVPRMSQVHLYYRGHLIDGSHAAGSESLDAKLVEWAHIPWRELAFPTVEWALNHWFAVRDQARFFTFTNPEGEAGDLPSFVARQAT
jgi:ADP-ribose pyrophosphatase YjhB (NUDIX family)